MPNLILILIVASETTSAEPDQPVQEESTASSAADNDVPAVEDQGDQTIEAETSGNEPQVKLLTERANQYIY